MQYFIGMIGLFGFNFAPRDWAFCEGQLLQISSYTALFSLLGTIYGGDGRTTFGLPDLRGRVPIHSGAGPGLTARPIGQKSGSETNTITTSQMAAHTHLVTVGGEVKLPVSENAATTDSPSNAFLTSQAADFYADTPAVGENAGALTNSLSVAIANTGSSTPVNNIQPSLVINYSICLVGLYPSRS